MRNCSQDPKRPVFLLLTGDLSLAARLQRLVDSQLGARVFWCSTMRDVRELLETESPVGMLVEMPRRSPRMLRQLQALTQLCPVVAITRPHDEDLARRCLAAGARSVVPRTHASETKLLERVQDLATGHLASQTA